MKPTVVKCHADLAGNTYLKEKDSKTDLCSYICNDGLEKEETEIRDLFDYYYGEENKRRNTYNLGSLDPIQVNIILPKIIKNFTHLAAPLNSLLKKNISYKWTNKQQEAFEVLKNKLITALVLAYPDFSKTFILFTDASNLALGAILSQKVEEENEHVVYYASRSLSMTEKNYSVTEKECLAGMGGR
ncbi:15661_t:CDS:2, partial [Gigaspora rosea]